MANEREDGVERQEHEGRVYRWSRSGSGWPGHTLFVAIRGGQVVIGDRYAGEGVERTYACHPQELLDGCFQALVSEQLGSRVLDELIAEVSRELGLRPSVTGLRPPVTGPTAQQPEIEGIAEAVVLAKVVSAPPVGGVVGGAAQVDMGARVDVAVVACESISLPLAVALRGLTRAPVKDLLGKLRQLPCSVLEGVSRVDAERVRERLAGLGATVELLPARA